MNTENPSNQNQFAERFESVFARLLSGEQLDLYEEGVSRMFEVIAGSLLADVPERKFMWYDGVVELTAHVRKPHQIEFNGEMWVGDIGDGTKQWKEPFRARVTDKRVIKQGLWISLWLGTDKVEGELSNILQART